MTEKKRLWELLGTMPDVKLPEIIFPISILVGLDDSWTSVVRDYSSRETIQIHEIEYAIKAELLNRRERQNKTERSKLIQKLP